MSTEPLIINGKQYPLWEQFVQRKDEWIGGVLTEDDESTRITDVILEENGTDSALFRIVGEDFSCGFDVHHGGIHPDHVENGLAFQTMMGRFTIQKKGEQVIR